MGRPGDAERRGQAVPGAPTQKTEYINDAAHEISIRSPAAKSMLQSSMSLAVPDGVVLVCVCASTFSSRTATRESPKQNWRASPSGFLLRSSLVRLLFLGLASGLCKDSRRAFRHRLCKGLQSGVPLSTDAPECPETGPEHH